MNQIDVRITNASPDFLVALAKLLNTQSPSAPEQLTGTSSDSPAPFDANLAATVFGAKVETPPAPQGYAPPAPDVTAQRSISNLPAATVGGGTPGGAGAPLDSKGRPWDARIHSSSHEKLVKTGEWKIARNKDPALVVQVLAELDAVNGAINPAAQVPQIPQAPAAPQGYAPPAAPAYTPPVPSGPQYGEVVNAITTAIAGGKVQPIVVGQMLAHFGVKDIVDLENHSAQWQTILDEIKRLSGAQ